MKITVDIDDKRLKSLMRLAGLRTKKDALDYTLKEAEKQARLESLSADPMKPGDWEDAYDPDYNPDALRKQDKPSV